MGSKEKYFVNNYKKKLTWKTRFSLNNKIDIEAQIISIKLLMKLCTVLKINLLENDLNENVC